MLTERKFMFWKKYEEFAFAFFVISGLMLLFTFFPFCFLFETVFSIVTIIWGFSAALILSINGALVTLKPWLKADSYSEYKEIKLLAFSIVHYKG